MELKFYICEHCGNIIVKVKDAKVPVMCCGQKMTEIIPGTVEASKEKHIPVYETAGGVLKVNVGAVMHPATAEHHIAWVALETNAGCQLKYITVGEAPSVSFALSEGEKVKAVYAYCNLHGLWKA